MVAPWCFLHRVPTSRLQLGGVLVCFVIQSSRGHVLVLFRTLSGASYEVQASGPSGDPVSNPIWANDLGCLSHSTSQDPGVRKDKEGAVCA